ncbi:MAG: Crp/Fnr family transcriptional regulator [Bauldia sp.]|nr:Crp/Fnr family transcriptional regulator [Bauldia sp.]
MRRFSVERRLGRGEVLFRRDDAAIGLYAVEEGKIRLSRIDADGREVILHSAGPGDLVAEASLFSPRYHCEAVAVTDTRVRLYPKRALLAEFRHDPRAADAFMAMLARELMALRTRLEQRNLRSASARVRHHLALNAGADGRTVTLQGTIKDLAAELGLTHEALYRTLNKLESGGQIARGTGTITLKKEDGT